MSSKRYVVNWTEVDGLRVRYRAALPERDAPRVSMPVPMILVHGLGCSADTWGRTLLQFTRMRADQAVYAMDLPGYGRTEKPAQTMSVDELADWTVRFMDELGIDTADLAASSLGCQVAVALAQRHPDRVRRMVLLGPTIGGAISMPQYGMRLLADSFREPFLYNLRLLRMYAEMGPACYASTVRKMMDDPVLDRAAAVDAPTLVLRGNNDAIVTRRDAQTLSAALPHGTFAELDHSAHAAQFARPRAFVETLLTYVCAPTVKATRTLSGRAVA